MCSSLLAFCLHIGRGKNLTVIVYGLPVVCVSQIIYIFCAVNISNVHAKRYSGKASIA